MNTTLRLAALVASLTLAHAALAETLRFVGRDGDWFKEANWSGGRVPGRGDSVVIGDGKNVVVDPPSAGYTVRIENVFVSSLASLETRPGTVWVSRNEFVRGRLIHRGTDASTDLRGIGVYSFQGNGTEPGWSLNPTPKSKRTIILQSSISIGLGGTEAAGPGKVGRGYYANVKAETAFVSGPLRVDLMYGFAPRAGDVFRIVRADRIVGRYADLPEGALVKRVGNIGLFIHYTAREHILLARQVG